MVSGVTIPEMRPISDLRTHLSEIEQIAKQTGEPVVLTRNGAASLVVLDSEEYNKRVRALQDGGSHAEAVDGAEPKSASCAGANVAHSEQIGKRSLSPAATSRMVKLAMRAADFVADFRKERIGLTAPSDGGDTGLSQAADAPINEPVDFRAFRDEAWQERMVERGLV